MSRLLSRPVMIAIVLVAAVIGALAGKVLMPVSHTAEARLVVGSQALSAQQVPGYTTATASLAETYARFLTNSTIATPQTKDVSAVRATAIADSPVVRVEADASSDAQAIAGANAAAKSIVGAANGDPSTGGLDEVEKRIRDATSTYNQARRDVASAISAYKDYPTTANKTALDDATSRQSLAQFTLNGLGTAYQNSIAASAGSPMGVRVISPAKITTAQSKKPLEMGALAGAGLAILALGALSMLRRHERDESDGLTD